MVPIIAYLDGFLLAFEWWRDVLKEANGGTFYMIADAWMKYKEERANFSANVYEELGRSSFDLEPDLRKEFDKVVSPSSSDIDRISGVTPG
jgi:hypothetical protein